MAKIRKPQDGDAPEDAHPPEEGSDVAELVRRALATGSTGRRIMVFQRGADKTALATLRDKAGVAMVSTADAGGAQLTASDIGDGGLFLDKIGIGIAPMDSSQTASVAAAGADNGVRFSRPERLIYAVGNTAPPGGSAPFGPTPGMPPIWTPQMPVPPLPMNGLSPEYLIGYRDAIIRFVDGLLGTGPTGTFGGPVAFSPIAFKGGAQQAADNSSNYADTPVATWGLQAIKVFDPPFQSSFSGQGVRVAVLDTGLDLGHPDFQDGRVTQTQSFVGSSVQDGHGHGTWCAGVAFGTRTPGQGPRYAVAYGTQLCIGKVLLDSGSTAGQGTEMSLFQGLNWAINLGCRVVSISISTGTPGHPGPPKADPAYDQIGRAALENNVALIAAAGNDSIRPGYIAWVGQPANSVGFMSVGAVDYRLRIAPFSDAAVPGTDGAVDVVGPGVDCYGPWPRPTLYQPKMSGTSMATPHVAGIAALIAEARPEYRAADILNAIMMLADPLSQPSSDVGKGIAQAPADDT